MFNELVIDNLSFKYYFRDFLSLNQIYLQIKKGEFIIITGPSGSGKSSLCYALTGLIPHFYSGDFSGSISFDGTNILELSPSQISQYIGYIPQRIGSALATPYIFTELSFPLECQAYSKQEILQNVFSTAEKLGLQNFLSREVNTLSEGEKQKVILGSALVHNPPVIVADEPLANLDLPNRNMILRLFEYLSCLNKTIIIFTHNYHNYLHLATRLIELKKGHIKQDYISDTKNKNSFQISNEDYTSKGSDPKKKDRTNTRVNPDTSFLQIQALSFNHSNNFFLNELSHSFPKGSIIGLVGENGSGKTTLLELISGLCKPKEGKILLNHTNILDLSWRKRAEFFGFVPQTPENHFFEETVRKEIKLISDNIKHSYSESDIADHLRKASLENFGGYSPYSLSEGEKRRLAYISATFHDPSVILLDEITNGLDFTNLRWLKTELIKQKKKDKLILIASHDWKFIAEITDEILLLDEGQLSHLSHTQFKQYIDDQILRYDHFMG